MRAQSRAPVLYPCQLPAGASLSHATLSGDVGRQQSELIFGGPFEMAIRQSDVPPAVNADPTGASTSTINLFPNVEAELIERNDGSRRALYHLFWTRDGRFYELQAFGPPQQRRTILQIATSLE